ncbi:MAG: helix-turn-helix transcriptional regulator [Actinomycetota bacterium]
MARGKALPLSPLISVEELADILGVPVNTVYKWRHRGLGPAPIRVGRFLRFDPEDVRSWLEGRKAASVGKYRVGSP